MIEISDSPVLAGAVNGKIAFADMIRRLPQTQAQPQPLFLDFSGIDVATASYLRESVFALKDYLRARNSSYYPVVANALSEVWDEVSVIASAKNDVIVACEVGDSDDVQNIELIGNLDPKQQMTFEMVLKFGEVDANFLMKNFGDAERTKNTTAWNNRLANLAARGVVREHSRGRSKFYTPVVTEKSNGN
ncbi:hypothetical protein H6M51_10925 [Rhizobium sp. AQ_MP]|uniref:hypothetical protein n=1 Tax=Rhizobium sp. AQ_MP TaxID=2761536 RepID=UPI00163B3EA5|nr:hypothetical protein [Rhizobium sp. AQ_MP]MBC2773380.1 hypothetical protein [Rhizobium sp. AQ_MP]